MLALQDDITGCEVSSSRLGPVCLERSVSVRLSFRLLASKRTKPEPAAVNGEEDARAEFQPGVTA